MYHKIIVVGNLGRDPEMRYTPDGTPVTNFSVASNRSYNNAAGEKVEEVTWFRVAAWRGLAEVCNQYLSKGRPVLVEGRLQSDENGGPRVWEGTDGEARASYELTAENVRFIGGGNGSEASTEAAPTEVDEIPF